MKYIINTIQNKFVNVSFIFDDETLTVNLNNMPTHDNAMLDRALSDYALEYIASRGDVAAVVVSKVGVPQEVTVEVVESTEVESAQLDVGPAEDTEPVIKAT